MGYLLGILALWLRMQMHKEEVRGGKTKKGYGNLEPVPAKDT